jgi:hypothetical protein
VPERLDRVEVLAGRHPCGITISLDAREQLLERLGTDEGIEATVDALRGVDPSRPVPLELADKQLLLNTIEDWIEEVRDYNRLPPGIWDLLNALVDDLHDAGRG